MRAFALSTVCIKEYFAWIGGLSAGDAAYSGCHNQNCPHCSLSFYSALDIIVLYYKLALLRSRGVCQPSPRVLGVAVDLVSQLRLPSCCQGIVCALPPRCNEEMRIKRCYGRYIFISGIKARRDWTRPLQLPRCHFTIKTRSVKHWCHCIVTLDPDSHQAIESIMQLMCFVLSIYCPRTSSVDVIPTAFRTQPRFDTNSARSHPTPPNLRPSFHTDELSTEHIFIFKKKKTILHS